MAMAIDRQDSVSAATNESEIVRAAAAALRDKHPLRNVRLKQAAEALQSGRADEAERLLSKYVEQRPDDPGALLLLAETALKLCEKQRADALLSRCVALAPDYEAGRF